MMQDYVDLDSLTRNTRRLEFEDGLNDFQNGIIFLLLGVLNSLFMSRIGIELFIRAILLNEEITIIALLALIPLFYLLTFGIRRLIRRYRREVLWRHLGEIEPFKWQVDTRFTLAAIGVWLIVIIVGFILFSGDPGDLDAGMRVIAAAGGAATAVIYFAMGRMLKLERFRWVGLVGMVLSLLLLVIPFSASLSWIAFGVTWALILGVSGSLALRNTLVRLREQLA
jgi:hypothetical protein